MYWRLQKLWLLGLTVSVLVLFASCMAWPLADPPETLDTLAVVFAITSGIATIATAAGTIATTVIAIRIDQREREIHDLERRRREADGGSLPEAGQKGKGVEVRAGGRLDTPRETLRKAIQSAYTPAELRIDAREQLSFNLSNEVQEDAAFNAVVFDLIAYCERYGRLGDLIDMIIRRRPERTDLKATLEQIRDRPLDSQNP
jgi:Effector-associated domain 1